MSNDIYEYQAGLSNWARAVDDVKSGWGRRRLWLDMAIRSFNSQYKGAVFGAFWLTVTTAMTAAGLGILYGYLFNRPLAEHLPYVACAIIAWSLITGFATSGCQVFVGNAHSFKEFPLPASLFAYRLATTQLLTVMYRSIVLVLIFTVLSVAVTPVAILSVLGLLMIVWIGFWMSLFLGVINARYRDFGQLVGAFITFSFFLTPIFWLPERLGDYSFYVNFNPFYHMIEVVRAPLLGREHIGLHFTVVGAFSIIAPLLGGFAFGRLSHRLTYWC